MDHHPDFKPLHGIRVAEVTHMVMGPVCGMILSALGAEVIKVEPPAGDKTRQLSGMGTAFFPLFNRGKRSVTVEFGTEAGRAKLHRILSTCDVLVENLREGTLDTLGLNADELRKLYPLLVIASCKGFLAGPYEGRPAMDEVVQMMSGLAYMTGPEGRPLRAGTSVVDIMGGVMAALGAVAALMQRSRTGTGYAVQSGLFETSVFLVAQHMVQFQLSGIEPRPMPERDFSWPVYDIFQTADGQQLFIGAVTEAHWTNLCRGLSLEQLLDDPRLAQINDRIAARSWILPIVSQAVAACAREELMRMFERYSVPHAAVLRPAQLYDDPHVLRPGTLIATTMPDGTVFQAPALPLDVGGRPLTVDGYVPALGEADSDFADAGSRSQRVKVVGTTHDHG